VPQRPKFSASASYHPTSASSSCTVFVLTKIVLVVVVSGRNHVIQVTFFTDRNLLLAL